MKPSKPALLVLCLIAATAFPSSAAPATEGRMPDLLDRAVARGQVSRVQADVMLARVLAGGKAPAAYRGTLPWHGTTVLLDIERRLRDLSGLEAQMVIQALGPVRPGRSRCGTSLAPTTQVLETEHFRIEHTVVFGGLTVEDYAAALEQTWATEVDAFGWAAPPVEEGERYLVRIDPLLEPFIYGFVAGTEEVGDNPNTAWDDEDALASCMVLNANYDNGIFPSTPRGAMEATAAHEFNHSLQFGYGALTGNDAPQSVFVEGGATWMEDEVFDGANDSWFYLWPDFTDSMGGNEDFPYSYWVIFRGLTERFGASVAGGGEDVFQRFWEEVSKGQSTGLSAMRAGMTSKGVSLDTGFHDMAVAAAFVKACDGGYVLPSCFEEAEGYLATAGRPPLNGFLQEGEQFDGTIQDHYATKWVGLPTGGAPLSLTLTTVDDGVLRGTIACDTGTTITRTALSIVDAPGESATATYDGSGCVEAALVITNHAATSDAPNAATSNAFTASLA